MTEGTADGTGNAGQPGAEGNQTPGWIAQLPDDLKTNQTFTSFKTIGDLAKAHLETTGRVKEFEGKVANSIPKLSDKSTPEEKAAFYKALGRPEKAGEYEFPKGEGVEHDPKMIEWARTVFHGANLTKDQAAVISQAWDGFIAGMVKSEEETTQNAMKEAETKLKDEWKADYDKNIELTKRAFKKFSGTELNTFLEETGIGNHPILIKAFHAIGKAMGEDTSPAGLPSGEQAGKEGMIYKVPNPT